MARYLDLETDQANATAALARIERAAVTGADRRTVELARAHTLRTVLIRGGVLIGGVLLALGGGYAWGRSSVAETDRRLVAAFSDGPDAAAAWVGLMEQNDVLGALAGCKGNRVYADATGRKVCTMPLWIEAPKRTVAGN